MSDRSDLKRDNIGRPRAARLGVFVLWYTIPALAMLGVIAYMAGAVVWHANPPIVPVAGVSMRPTLQPGDLVVLKGVEEDELEKGDIVAFNVPQSAQEDLAIPGAIVHRIMKIERSGDTLIIHTKGDANAGEDAFTIRADAVIGRVVKRVPGGGYPLLFFRSRQGKIFLGAAIVVTLLYFLLGLLDRRRELADVNMLSMATIVAEARELKETMQQTATGARGPPDAVVLPEGSALPRRPAPGHGWPASPGLIPSPDGGLVGAGSPALEQLATEVHASSKQSRENAETMRELVGAIGEYGEHLRSHTAVMQGLAGTTTELHRAASELSAAVAGQPARPAEEPRPAAPTGEQPAPAAVPPAPFLRPGGVSSRRQQAMAIDPTEVRQPEFERSFRAFATEQPIERLLGRAAAALDKLAGERDELRTRLELVEQELAHYRQLETSTIQALIAAERNAQQIVSREGLGDTVRQLQAAAARLTTGQTGGIGLAAPAPVYGQPPPPPPAPTPPTELSAIDQLKAMGVWPKAHGER